MTDTQTEPDVDLPETAEDKPKPPTHSYNNTQMLEMCRSVQKAGYRLDCMHPKFENDMGVWSPDQWLYSMIGPPEDHVPVPVKKRGNTERGARGEGDSVTLAPQRRSFNAGCKRATSPHAIERAVVQNNEPPQPANDVRASSGRGRGKVDTTWRGGEDRRRQHEGAQSQWRGYSGNGRDSWRERNGYGNNNRHGRYNERDTFTVREDSLPEWATEGPESMMDTIELHGFDDDPNREEDLPRAKVSPPLNRGSRPPSINNKQNSRPNSRTQPVNVPAQQPMGKSGSTEYTPDTANVDMVDHLFPFLSSTNENQSQQSGGSRFSKFFQQPQTNGKLETAKVPTAFSGKDQRAPMFGQIERNGRSSTSPEHANKIMYRLMPNGSSDQPPTRYSPPAKTGGHPAEAMSLQELEQRMLAGNHNGQPSMVEKTQAQKQINERNKLLMDYMCQYGQTNNPPMAMKQAPPPSKSGVTPQQVMATLTGQFDKLASTALPGQAEQDWNKRHMASMQTTKGNPLQDPAQQQHLMSMLRKIQDHQQVDTTTAPPIRTPSPPNAFGGHMPPVNPMQLALMANHMQSMMQRQQRPRMPPPPPPCGPAPFTGPLPPGVNPGEWAAYQRVMMQYIQMMQTQQAQFRMNMPPSEQPHGDIQSNGRPPPMVPDMTPTCVLKQQYKQKSEEGSLDSISSKDVDMKHLELKASMSGYRPIVKQGQTTSTAQQRVTPPMHDQMMKAQQTQAAALATVASMGLLRFPPGVPGPAPPPMPVIPPNTNRPPVMLPPRPNMPNMDQMTMLNAIRAQNLMQAHMVAAMRAGDNSMTQAIRHRFAALQTQLAGMNGPPPPPQRGQYNSNPTSNPHSEQVSNDTTVNLAQLLAMAAIEDNRSDTAGPSLPQDARPISLEDLERAHKQAARM